MALICNGERRRDDDEGVRQREEHRPDHDADGPVDRIAEHQVLQETLIAEQIDQRDAGQQRGNQDRDGRDYPEEALEGHQASVERVGKAKRDGDDEHRADHAHQHGIGDRLGQRRCREIGDEIGKADAADRAQHDAAERVGIELGPVGARVQVGPDKIGAVVARAANAIFDGASKTEVRIKAGDLQAPVRSGVERAGRDRAGVLVEFCGRLRLAGPRRAGLVAALDLEGRQVEAVGRQGFRQEDVERRRQCQDQIKRDDEHQAVLDDVVGGKPGLDIAARRQGQRIGRHLTRPSRRREPARAAVRPAWNSLRRYRAAGRR